MGLWISCVDGDAVEGVWVGGGGFVGRAVEDVGSEVGGMIVVVCGSSDEVPLVLRGRASGWLSQKAWWRIRASLCGPYLRNVSDWISCRQLKLTVEVQRTPSVVHKHGAVDQEGKNCKVQ